MGRFGFSNVGTAFLLALFIPNVIWALFAQPEGYDPSSENRVLRTMSVSGRC